MYTHFLFFFFFFQAEDGIRDYKVTGVQTCALPIYMVLSVVGLCLAGGADYDEAAALGNVAGGLEVEKIGVALLSRQEILRDLIDHSRPEDGKRLDGPPLVAEVVRRRQAGQTIVFTNG